MTHIYVVVGIDGVNVFKIKVFADAEDAFTWADKYGGTVRRETVHHSMTSAESK